MTSTEDQLNKALDKQNAQLTGQELRDISQVRLNALRAKKSRIPVWRNSKMLVPALASVCLLVVILYHPEQGIPPLPREYMSLNVPTEDLALLEDLDFVDWLANNEE